MYLLKMLRYIVTEVVQNWKRAQIPNMALNNHISDTNLHQK